MFNISAQAHARFHARANFSKISDFAKFGFKAMTMGETSRMFVTEEGLIAGWCSYFINEAGIPDCNLKFGEVVDLGQPIVISPTEILGPNGCNVAFVVIAPEDVTDLTHVQSRDNSGEVHHDYRVWCSRAQMIGFLTNSKQLVIAQDVAGAQGYLDAWLQSAREAGHEPNVVQS